jgi:hypothetical protein
MGILRRVPQINFTDIFICIVSKDLVQKKKEEDLLLVHPQYDHTDISKCDFC